MALFPAHVPPVWLVLLNLAGLPGAWLTRRASPNVVEPRGPSGTGADLRAAETGHRAAFVDMLMAEITGMRQVIKAYEIDTEMLRERLNTALSHSLVLRATLEIMEKRVALLKDRQARCDSALPPHDAAGQAGPGDAPVR